MQLSQVRQLRPRLDSFEFAVSAFRDAEYDRAWSYLHGLDTFPAMLLRTRVLLRLDRPADALSELNSVDLEDLGSADAAEATGLLAFARMSNCDPSEVESLLLDARVRACSAGSASLEADAEYLTAVYLFTQGRFEDARTAAQRVLEVVPVESAWLETTPRVFSRFELRARAYDFLGHLEGRELRFNEQASYTRLALEELDKVEFFDHYIQANALNNLGMLAAKLDISGAYEYVQDRLNTVRFSSFTRKLEFEIRRSLGCCAALRGDHIGALREFRRSADAAPTVAARIQAIVDRSTLAHEISERTFAAEESDYAMVLCKQVNWNEISGDELFSLLAVAQNLAGRDAVEARRAFEQYVVCKRRHAVTSAAVGQLFFIGWENQVDAEISRAEDRADRAIRASLDAFDIFKRVGYVWRAAAVAIDLFELTGEASYLAFAKSYAVKLPQSHLARRVERCFNAEPALA